MRWSNLCKSTMSKVFVFHLSCLASLCYKPLWILHSPISVQAMSPECSLCSDHCKITCSQGFYVSSGLCAECPVGYYCPGNVSAPRKCPIGTYNYHTGKEGIEDCLPCPTGFISTEDGSTCRPCPAGLSCDLRTGTIMPCGPGEHSPEGFTACLPCPSGFTCVDGHQRKCGPGQEPNPTKTECVECPAGSYSTDANDHCHPCPAGNYCPSPGTAQPLPCPVGQYASRPGQVQCQNCNGTSHCGRTLGPLWNRSEGLAVQRAWIPTHCPPGTYRNQEEGMEPACSMCPLGHYCTGGIAVPCPAGRYGAKEGLQRERDCSLCPAGFYCLEGSASRPGSQSMCSLGYYCEEGTGVPHGTPCPVGTAGGQLAQTTRAACKRCAEGRFCPAGSAVPGLPCARGKFCPAGTLEEINCPKGTFTPHQGATSVKDCLKCPAGFYCLEGASDPAPCQPGTFNPLEGQDDPTDCRPCYPGKACTQGALKGPDVDCMQGFVCPPGSSSPSPPAGACPPGTFSNRSGLSDRSQCQRCPPRYACLRGTGGLQRPALACFPGHFCPPGTMYPTQHKCPAGTWSEQSGMLSERECQPCPRGWYCLPGSGVPSGRCSSGHYCPEGTQYGSQYPCPPGTYSTKIGNGQREDCQFCPEGHYCLEGTAKPTPCLPRTFRRLKGGQQAQDCSACPAGYSCPHPATISPRACGAGSYSDEGSVECAPCLQGHYCSDETTSEEAMLREMICPPGLLCSRGLDREPQRSATLCPIGFYCPGGSVNPSPIPCPNGTYGGQPGLRDVTECLTCPEGHFCFSEEPQDHPISAPTGRCPAGHQCPPGTGHPLSFPCQAGFFRNNSYGHRGALCAPCPAGYLCAGPATHTPSVCPEGFYCPGGSRAPEPCEEGTYGPRPALRNASECSPCDGGRYCSGVGRTTPSGDCREGFYCRERATSATPADGPTGGLCPAGSFCPPGSAAPTPCPPGTFSDSSGLAGIQQCANCPPGYYCSGSSSTSPTGPCFAGHYCPMGSVSPTQHEVEKGQYSPAGAARAQLCPLGTFQPARGQASCLACERGHFCNQTGLGHPTLCPPGHYCPTGTSVPHPCPPGSYLARAGGEEVQHCGPCDAGSFCRSPGLSAPQGPCGPGFYCSGGVSTSTPVNTSTGGFCPAGYYCPSGTRHPQEYPCPPGTWSNAFGATDASSCWLCPAGFFCNGTALVQPSGLCAPGFYCRGGAASSTPDDSVTGQRCPLGFHCPTGSTAPLKCPDGTYANSTGASRCMDCPPGRYCTEAEGVQLCPEGHYCPGGMGEDVLPCPPGTYSPEPGQSHLEQCLLCPAGMYCEDWGLSWPTGPCQSGYFCLAGINFQNPDGNISTGVGGPCPNGHYCPVGTSLPLPCPLGTFSNRLHVTDRAGCSPCPPGQFCGSAGLVWPSGPCREGHYCPGGDFTPTGPEAGGGVCPVAHYCPPGSAAPVPCPAGTYTNLTGQTLCSRCHSGYYCPERISNYTRFPCPAGFYCPDGTRHATQYPCPRGYYNPEPMTQSLDSCLPCPPGHYCEKERLTAVSGKCKAGWFCVSAAWISQPFDLDNYTNANCLCPATSTGGRCQEGYYCPAGSPEPLPCPPGAFCNVTGLAQPVGPCSPGYYCSGGATHSRPMDTATGNICPPGTYCGEGSGEPSLCPAGSFSPVAGISSEAQCQLCTAGSYCSGPGLRAPTGPCSEGYWCPPGQTVGVAKPCPGGHYCPAGSPAPILCPTGTYQDREKQAVCLPCEPGYYCDQHFGADNGSTPQPCPPGYFCPPGTGTATQFGCPTGTFSPREEVIGVDGCLLCPPGKFCPAIGLSEPAGDCHAGFWCKEGARSASPTEGETGVACPAGHYCPSGTVAPVPCPLGTWWNRTGCKSPDECQPCSGGFYCDSPGLTAPSGPCSAGFYCTEGAVTPTPFDNMTGGRCPEHYYCPIGTSQPILCEPGTFMTVSQAAGCWPCPPGRYCVHGTVQLCPPGFYCPEGSGYDWGACPEGTYSADAGLTAISQCRACDPGHYCGQRNATAVTGPCREGYYCSRGNNSPQPNSHTAVLCSDVLECSLACQCVGSCAGEGGPCPAGHYCPRGVAVPQPCPEGTFSNLTQLVCKDDCIPCSPGHYCNSHGLTSPIGECWEGFFCHHGAVLPNSPIRDGRGGPCPPGYFCPKGVAAPQVCPEGSFSSMEGQASCSLCPLGYYCPGNGSSYQGNGCGTGHYCPLGSSSKYQHPCPAGTFNPHTRMGHLEDCLPCPPGYFCSSLGLSAASGPCIAGHFCIAGATTPSPEDRKTGDKCPKGHYCPEGSRSPKQCPVGHYSNTSGNSEVSQCLPCPAGFSCASPGLSAPSDLCQAGYYCPLGKNSSSPTPYMCSPGHRCPTGSAHQMPCAPGTYQDQPGQADCTLCPAGHFCTGSSHPDTGHAPYPCPKGHYCPPGAKSGVEFPCPVGTFSDQTGLSSAEQCAPCPPGKYCGSAGLAAPTGNCSAGYLCILGAVIPQPDGDASGRRCSSGTYCPQGSVNIQHCPPGTYNPLEGAGSVDACLLCPRGQYCAGIGLAAPSGSCSPGHYCTLGSRSAEPQNLLTVSAPHASDLSGGVSPSPEEDGGGLCPRGHYCPAGNTQPLPCPPGTFLSKYGAQSEAECEPCPAAFYCPEWGQRSVELECPEGWFCPAGLSSGQLSEHRCPEGHACPSGSVKPALCPPGTHQPSPGQAFCSPCPPAFYCLGGKSATVPCSTGTLGQTEGGHSQQHCTPCPAGSYCNGAALTTPTGPCTAGHYCTLGAVEPAPVSQAYGDVCPPGHYCPQGSSSPVPCPMGTYLPNKGAPSPSFCTPCPPGHYCGFLGATQPSGLCSPGHYCTERAQTATPQASSSDLGCSCDVILKAANNVLSLCSWGQNTTCHFQDAEGYETMGRSTKAMLSTTYPQNDTDIACTSFTGDICPQGFFCPEGSSVPLSCDQGLYCNQAGLASPAGPCEAGFFCPKGSTHPRTSPCPPGNYCPLGTPYPLPCPPGTLQTAPGGSALEDCPPCPPGHYCSQSGLVLPSGPCAAGHYCPGGQATNCPSEHACTAGNFCEEGSSRETACSPGSYQPSKGQTACKPCPAGNFCPKEGVVYPTPCQVGFYCPMGAATQLLCPPGSYGNHSGLTEASQCSSCDPGMYCKGSGNTSPTGPCSAGFLCFGGSPFPSPTDQVKGARCPPGFYCPAGSSSPRPCPKGTFSEQSGLAEPSQCRPCSPGFYCSEPGLRAASGPCLPGYFCLEGSESAAPGSSAFGGVCSPGHYCESGTATPTPCPAGTHRPESGGRHIDDCVACPAGWFQGQGGQTECTPCPPGFHCPPPSRGPSTAIFPLPCPVGYFCPQETPPRGPAPCPKGTYSSAQGLSAAGQCLACPEGFFCGSEGLVQPTGHCSPGFLCFGGAQVPNPTDLQMGSPCPRGAFCQQGVIIGLCTAGHYCDRGSSSPEPALCPAGFFCPRGTDAPAPCPPGTFSPRRGNVGQDDCIVCSAGHFCQGEGVVQPEPCPSGHYCPPGVTVGTGFPCPPGTVRPQHGGAGIEDCQPCPAGMFCALPGSAQPTGPCQAGFHCPPGASSPNSTGYRVRSAANALCPPGHYCPAGEGYPLPCPPGSYSSSVGLRRVEQCQACPAGHYCAHPALIDVSEAVLCDAGYVCLGGSVSPRPSDGLQGYLCPRGYHCPIGTPAQVPCEPGSYSPTPGAALCAPCPPGTTCPSPATQEPSTCPAGHYCEDGTGLAWACPAGTLSELTGAQSPSTCVPCPAGQYCSTPGSSQPQGQCQAGYFCQGAATDSAPQSSASFPRNGPCPLGHYCPAGTASPLPCPTGSVLNHTGGRSMDSCLPCPPGQYCAGEGLDYPSGPCSAGFYCPPSFSSTSPLAFLCPKGHYCPEGSGHPLPCPTGAYQPNPGSSSCIPCRPGFYCEETAAGDPSPCPAHSYCPAATMVPLACPNGTFTPPDLTGLQEEGECLPCPPGRFCRAGRVLGYCAAGYLCFSASSEATPQGPPLQNWSQCRRGVQCAGPCPAGFYCVEGSKEPQACPAHTLRTTPSASSRQDCLPCPPKHWCREGDPSLHICPAGHYCDGLGEGEREGGGGPKECPIFTYRSTPGAGNRGDCLPCPAGTFCNDTGLNDYSTHPCPPGFWCSGAGPPVLCPAGTMRPLPGAGSPSQCVPCVAGTYCPDPVSTGRLNIHGTPCQSGFQCPSGSMMESPCPAGSYCGPGTAEPVPCPEGYFCPEGSDKYNTLQQVCTFPRYCPVNSSAARLCDGGYMPLNTSGLRGSRDSSCMLCEGGTYRPGSSTAPHCLTCPEGYHCPPGTEHYWSNPCPFGYFCPLGSENPTPCPPGSYGNSTHAKHPVECHPCPVGTFNHLSAQRACFPCGSSSHSPEGSASCVCLGQNRAFQHSDGSCLCKTGFVFYNQLDYKSTDADSVLDCQPEVSERCGGGQVRLASSRKCVSPSAHLCNVTCGSHGGHLNVELGICHCERYVAMEELCNASCLLSIPHVSARMGLAGQLLLKVKGQETREVGDILGPDIHVKTIGSVHFAQFDSEGVFGWIMTNRTIINRFLSAEPRTQSERESRRRRDASNLREFSNSDPVPRIPNPIACLASNDMLLFQLSINFTDRHLSHFPVYQKDHLFSSNPSWDFGAFRRLEQLIKHSQYNSSRFAHVFTESGKYVFLDNAVPDRSLIVVVSEHGTECDPAASAFQPASPAQLVRHGILRQPRLNLLPNWGTITVVLGLLVLLVVILIATALVLKPDRVGLIAQGRPKPKWRSLGEPCVPPGYVYAGGSVDVCDVLGHRGVGEGAEAEEPAVCRGYKSGRVELEEFNVKTLYDKLEDQTLHLVSQLAKHRKDNLEFYRNICQQTDSLKDLLENMDMEKLSQLREVLALKSGADGTTEKEVAKDPSMSLLEAALRAVEGLTHRAERESWARQGVAVGTCPGDAGNCEEHTGYTHGFPESEQFSSPDMAEPKVLQATVPRPNDTADHLSPTDCLSEPDLSKLLALTPLSRTLQEIQQSLQSWPSVEEAVFHESEEEPVGHLVPVALGDLSPHHFAVFLFGCRVVSLLCSGHGFPPLTLLLARSVPLSRLAGLAEHCHGEFYFDSTNRILYLQQDKLGNAGEFIAMLLHSMAFIASGSTSKDFIQTFHRAVSALSLALFHTSFTSKINKTLEVKEEFTGTLAEEFLSVKVPTETGFSEHQLAERLQKFKFFKLQQCLRDIKSNQAHVTESVPGNRDTAAKVLSVEQEIDRLNEVFLQLSVGLQGRTEKRAGQDCSSPTQGTPESCLSRHGTLLLDLKRRCVAQRLSEMQAQLAQLSMQQPGSQETESQADSQGLESKEPGIQGPECQEPGSQGLESHEPDNLKPDYQGPDSELAESQKKDGRDSETQISENIQTSFSLDPEEKKSPLQILYSQKSDDHNPESEVPKRQPSEGHITEESALPAGV